MKKWWMALVLCTLLAVAPTQQSHAIVWAVIKAAAVKVIKAIDLQIQRLQNKTIWLQNAQKTLENTMSKLKLEEIAGWVEKQRTLYKDYYDELWRVKSIISYYQRIKDIIQRQVDLVDGYKTAYALFKKDKHFTPDEIEYMGRVYGGILDASLKNLDQLYLVINSFSTQMTDAKRLEIINRAAYEIDRNYADLQEFNLQNKMLSLHRAKDEQDVATVKALYGLK
jgi:hypothetical protein